MKKNEHAKQEAKSVAELGLDRNAQKGRQRTINEDGTYNVDRITGKIFGNFNPYHWVISTSWANYWLVMASFYTIMNVLFATAYHQIGVDQLYGIPEGGAASDWLYCFFFSAQSFTTVGYGSIHPVGEWANVVATVEAFIGLMTFALATGTLYGRFSKPVSRIKYSSNVLIAPYKDGMGMQFMIANELGSSLMEVEVKVNLSWVEADEKGNAIRRFQQAVLEYDKIAMFPTSWIVNHPINEESTLFGKSLEDIKALDFEVFVLLKAFDDLFSQTIYSRHSFMADQFIMSAKFRKPFSVQENGRVKMDLTKVGEYDFVSE